MFQFKWDSYHESLLNQKAEDERAAELHSQDKYISIHYVSKYMELNSEDAIDDDVLPKPAHI